MDKDNRAGGERTSRLEKTARKLREGESRILQQAVLNVLKFTGVWG